MRCVACGALPSEGCNQRTHVVHDRLWSEVYDPDGAYSQSKRRSPDRPNCRCHNEPMWSLGENWTCRIRMGAEPGTFNTTRRGSPRVDA